VTAQERINEAIRALRIVHQRQDGLSRADGVALLATVSALAMALALENAPPIGREELEAAICQTAKEYRKTVHRAMGDAP
jgi:ApbE superfamily uncharacterized protein (UPF0280 family)